jgi:Cys-tRNA(Pro)/Cys-tRNA(Cys) deacylase
MLMGIINNVTRLLDSHKIQYTAYELPSEKLGTQETASLLGVDESIVFKTIVVTREKPKKPILIVLPGTRVVDLKLVATTLGEKKVTLPTEREAETITGSQAGGISPLALINKGFTVVIDVSARYFTEIHISGGQRGLNIRLGVDDLSRLTKAKFAAVSRRVLGAEK